MARCRVSSSWCADIKMTGSFGRSVRMRRCNSIPLMPGIRTSVIRHVAPPRVPDVKNSSADENTKSEYPADSTRLSMDSRTRKSSRVLSRRRQAPASGHSSSAGVAAGLQQPTRKRPRPARPAGGGTGGPRSAPLFGLAPHGVCRASAVAGGAVRSYRTVSPLPDPEAGRSSLCCTFRRVAAPRR